jgi:uncharacterized repeat protein (TIGR03803 family)
MPIIRLAQPARETWFNLSGTCDPRIDQRKEINSRLWRWRRLCAVLCLCLAGEIAAQAQVLTILTRFTGKNGANPNLLVKGPHGNFSATASYGGPNSQGEAGTVFEISPTGVLTTLYNFCAKPNCADGLQSDAGLVLGRDRNFYGTTRIGGSAGNGTIFQVTPAGVLTTLYSFCSQTNCTDGSYPEAGLAVGSDGLFYGVTRAGGANNLGTLFSITNSGALNTLYSFAGIDGSNPFGTLVQATDGDFYGTTMAGGPGYSSQSSGSGTVFKISSTGALTTLYNFCSQANCADGLWPEAGLVQASDGNFYGTTTAGGGYLKAPCNANKGCGTVFKITSGGAFTVLHSFKNSDGRFPMGGLLQAKDRNLYGTTSQGGKAGGTVFEMTLSGTLTTLHKFVRTEGFGPFAGLIQGSDGTLYGTNTFGGLKANAGTVFSLTLAK